MGKKTAISNTTSNAAASATLPLNPSMTSKKFARDSETLMEWYRGARRDLPWRKNRDPYRIWISEVMLQQTTVAAVVPYYERFLLRFPTLRHLAKAPVEDVLENWAGLGYYSRARNLHKAALALLERGGFPRTHAELSELPGFGPYTARAVSSLAFGEKTGVLDGNVIRVLSRMYGHGLEWWKPRGRLTLQNLADQLAQVDTPEDLNQGLMELGATVCTPKNPACLLCPWVKNCVARQERAIDTLPMKKPRRDREVWIWEPEVSLNGDRVLLIENDYAPFLKGHWVPPGAARKFTKAPKRFQFKGTVTHHDIFVVPTRVLRRSKPKKGERWVPIETLSREVPSSLIRKAISTALNGARARTSKSHDDK